MQYKEFCTGLRKQGLGQLYLLTGEEPFYIDRALQLLLDSFFPEGKAAQDEGLTVLEDNVPLNRLMDAIETVPFFAEKNVVLVKGTALFKDKKAKEDAPAEAEKKKKSGAQEERFLQLLGDLPETSAVIFYAPCKPTKRKKLYKQIEKLGTVLESEALKSWQVADWVSERLRERQLEMERGAERYFAEAAGLMDPVSLGFLDKEMEKLELLAQGRCVTEKEVREAFSNVPEVSGFAILDAIDARDAKRALYLLERHLAENTYLPPLLAILAGHVRRLAQTKLLLAKGVRGRQLAGPLGLKNPYMAERVGRAAAGYDYRLLQRVYISLSEADYCLKTGQRGADMLEQAVIALVKR